MYKTSKFNYYIYNDNSELLLYNSMKGTDSFCKIDKNNSSEVHSILNKDRVEVSENDSVLASLLSKGFIINEDIDEDALCYKSYLKAINNNYLHLVINPTDCCNFKCVYCYETDSKNFMCEETQNALINYVKKEIRYYEGLRVSWFGGEPLLKLDVVCKLSTEFIKICRQQKRSYIASITTNGYFLDINTFEKLLDLRIIHYQITIDGPKVTHDHQRPLLTGHGTFDVILNNLLNIKNKCQRSYFNITLRTNYTKLVYPYLDEYLKLLETSFMDNKHFDVLIRPADDWGGERVSAVKSDLFGDNPRFIKSIIKKMHGYNLNFILMKNFFNPESNFCYAAKLNSLSINSKGEISKCTTDLHMCPEAKIGEIINGNFHINTNEQLKWIIPYNETCSCFFKPVCLGIKCPKAYCESKKLANDNKKFSIQCPFERVYIDDLFLLFDKKTCFLIF